MEKKCIENHHFSSKIVLDTLFPTSKVLELTFSAIKIPKCTTG